jgi:uncharacterized protein (TIGR02246 family)
MNRSQLAVWVAVFAGGCLLAIPAAAQPAGKIAAQPAGKIAAQPAGKIAAQGDVEVAAVRAAAEAFVAAFNEGQADALAAQFLPQGELIDEEGVRHQGREELQKLFTQYFTKFPGATLGLEIESIRVVGPNVALEEGTRFLTTKDNSASAVVRYTAVRAKTEGKWLIASIRETYGEAEAAPSERLQSLAWLVGDWVSEGSEAAVKIGYRWSEDKNFLLGDFHITKGGVVLMKSTQRIGWDPLTGQPRSWLFDSDGGFAEGSWTQVEEGWVVKSSATAPDGTTGTATLSIVPKGKDQFTMRGSERIVGGSREEDFEVVVVRQAPAAEGAATEPAAGEPAATAPATPVRPALPRPGIKGTKGAKAAPAPKAVPRPQP